MSENQKELLDRDAELYGIAFLVDGVRVKPDRVVIKYGAQASAAPEQEAVGMRFRRNDGKDRAWTHSPRTEPLGAGYQRELTYTHADDGEVERLRLGQLSPQPLLRESRDAYAEAIHWEDQQPVMKKVDAFLSATAQPADDMCNHDNPAARCICREEFGHRVCAQPADGVKS